MPDHLLGEEDPDVKRHLRGCAACRSDLAALDEGLMAVGMSMDQDEPPKEMQDKVLTALREEWADAPAAAGSSGKVSRLSDRRVARWLAVAAAAVMVVGSFAWALRENGRASANSADASAYRQFLGTLGGRDVREARLVPNGTSGFEGSAVIYDSMEGQSWVLIVGRAPGFQGTAQVTASSATGSIRLPNVEFAPNGQAYSVMVTAADLSKFDGITISSPDGTVLATGTLHG
jgi:hypothetical protein